MAKPAEKVGRGKCPQCDEPVTFKRSSGGLLTYACDCCDTSGYAQPGGAGFAAWSKSIKGAEPEPKAPAPPAASPEPAPAKRGFSMENL